MGPLPPFAEGLCFLCGTDGPPGDTSSAIGAVSEDMDARREPWLYSDEQLTRAQEILDLFQEAQGGETVSVVELGSDFAERFCFSTRPNAPTRARWLARHPPAPPKPLKKRAAQKPPKTVKIITFKGKHGRPIQPTSKLNRVVEHVKAWPGCSVAEVAQALGLGHREASKSLYSAREIQKVWRVGSHGHSRFYPGPRAEVVRPELVQMARMATLVATVTEPTLQLLERFAADSGLPFGAALENLLMHALGPRAATQEGE